MCALIRFWGFIGTFFVCLFVCLFFNPSLLCLNMTIRHMLFGVCYMHMFYIFVFALVQCS